MFREIEKCYLTYDGKQKGFLIYNNNGEAVITKGEETKKLDIKVIRSLDIFFNSIELEQAEGEAKGAVSLRFSEDNGMYYTDDKHIAKQLSDYLNAWFDGTAKPFTLSFHSFDGGGPEFSVEIEKTGVFTWYCQRHYLNSDHEMMCGSGFDMIFSFYPLRKGTATAIIRGDSPICPEPERRLFVEVADDLSTTYRIEDLN